MIRDYTRLLIIYELISSPRSCLWNSQVRYRYCRHVGDAAWTYHEVHHSRCHGGYYCHLWVGRGRTYCWFPWGTSHLPLVQVNSLFIFVFFTTRSDKQAQRFKKWYAITAAYWHIQPQELWSPYSS